MKSLRAKLWNLGLILVLVSGCGTRTNLRALDSSADLATVDALPSADIIPDASWGPCVDAPLIPLGGTVSGTTCVPALPPGTVCSEAAQTVFHRVELPAMSEYMLMVPARSLAGVLATGCQPGGCVVGPSIATGPTPSELALVNDTNSVRHLWIELTEASGTCRAYTLTLRRFR